MSENLKNEVKNFYQQSDEYKKMLNNQKEEDFKEYVGLINHWLKQGSSFLDLGCGLGQTTFYLSSLGYKVEGIDNSEKFITEAKEKFPNLNFYQGDTLNLPFPDESFDAVGSHNVIEHISDVPKFLKEQIRVVKNDGLIFISAPNLLSPLLPIKSLLSHNQKIFEGQKNKKELFKMFFNNIWLILVKTLNHSSNFIYRKPILTEVWPDYDACYYSSPLDLKKFFEESSCQILSYQKFTFPEKKSILQKIGARFLPEWMGIIRIVAKKCQKYK